MDSYDNDGLLMAMDDDLFPIDDAQEDAAGVGPV